MSVWLNFNWLCFYRRGFIFYDAFLRRVFISLSVSYLSAVFLNTIFNTTTALQAAWRIRVNNLRHDNGRYFILGRVNIIIGVCGVRRG